MLLIVGCWLLVFVGVRCSLSFVGCMLFFLDYRLLCVVVYCLRFVVCLFVFCIVVGCACVCCCVLL